MTEIISAIVSSNIKTKLIKHCSCPNTSPANCTESATTVNLGDGRADESRANPRTVCPDEAGIGKTKAKVDSSPDETILATNCWAVSESTDHLLANVCISVAQFSTQSDSLKWLNGGHLNGEGQATDSLSKESARSHRSIGENPS
jgi:hypothetical protein